VSDIAKRCDSCARRDDLVAFLEYAVDQTKKQDLVRIKIEWSRSDSIVKPGLREEGILVTWFSGFEIHSSDDENIFSGFRDYVPYADLDKVPDCLTREGDLLALKPNPHSPRKDWIFVKTASFMPIKLLMQMLEPQPWRALAELVHVSGEKIPYVSPSFGPFLEFVQKLSPDEFQLIENYW
jgi:hypothetical protein